ncbi:hypothetical protein R3I93_004607 [Phoxinus phoxinus]|uniref:Uncharacterized protein n=1 Tax=Phoxinus phoxinus TaxID=58324 RepID=A0AAN9DGR6_9TELE
MVIRAYKHIRECILTNAKVMSETTIQLPEVNAATVTQWFSRRCKSQEQVILKQGIQAPEAPMAGPENLPAAMQKGQTLYSANLAEPHLFVLPPNTAGEAKLKGRSQPQAIFQAPPSSRLPVIAPAPPVSLPFIVPPVQLPTVPGTSQVMFFNPITFTYATISSDTDIQSSGSLLHSAIQKEKTGEGAHWNCHKKVCEEDRRHSLQKVQQREKATITSSVLWQLVLRRV